MLRLSHSSAEYVAVENILADLRTSTLHDADGLAEGNGAIDYLMTLAEHSSDHPYVFGEVGKKASMITMIRWAPCLTLHFRRRFSKLLNTST